MYRDHIVNTGAACCGGSGPVITHLSVLVAIVVHLEVLFTRRCAYNHKTGHIDRPFSPQGFIATGNGLMTSHSLCEGGGGGVAGYLVRPGLQTMSIFVRADAVPIRIEAYKIQLADTVSKCNGKCSRHIQLLDPSSKYTAAAPGSPSQYRIYTRGCSEAETWSKPVTIYLEV